MTELLQTPQTSTSTCDEPGDEVEKLLGNPAAMDMLFNADPKTLTDVEIDAMCARFRKQRWEVLAEEASAKSKGKTPKPGAAAIKSVSIDDLDLGL